MRFQQESLPRSPDDVITMGASGLRQKGWLRLEKLRRLCRRNRRGAAVVEFAVVVAGLLCLHLGNDRGRPGGHGAADPDHRGARGGKTGSSGWCYAGFGHEFYHEFHDHGCGNCRRYHSNGYAIATLDYRL